MKIAIALALALLAQDKFKPRDLKDRAEIPGTLVCIGCALEKQDGGAQSECTLFARHAQGLKTEDGSVWTFVNNTKGNYLITTEKLRGKEVKILGWKFPKAQYIEVSKFLLKAGDKWVLWKYCKTCGFEEAHEGDTSEDDLCPGCRGDK
jgi:hypothetical protein